MKLIRDVLLVVIFGLILAAIVISHEGTNVLGTLIYAALVCSLLVCLLTERIAKRTTTEHERLLIRANERAREERQRRRYVAANVPATACPPSIGLPDT